MATFKNIKWVLWGSLLFITLNAIFIYNEFYLFSLLPFVVLLGMAAFLSLDKLLLVLVFFVPVSIPLSELVPGLPIDMFIPTEPLLAGLLLLFILKLLFEKQFDRRILLHPVSMVIYFYLAWMFITSIASTMPVVSLKMFLSRVWFIVTFYFLATQLFRETKNGKYYYLLYVYAFAIVIIYALYRHAVYGIFNEKIAHWSANPFYKDHTSYGAMLAFYIPPMIGLSLHRGYTIRMRTLYALLTALLLVGIAFSYSRAAWVSLVGALGVFFIIRFKIKFWIVALATVIMALFVATIGDELMLELKRNKQDSSTEFSDHVKSISNVSTDASNLERLNRWSCAIRMFKEKPFLGWGPGTYMFQYAPFQFAADKTIISTNEGDMGNAHSEYLGPLCEQGVFGALLVLVLMVFTIVTAMKTLKNNQLTAEQRMLLITALLGLVTYYLHGILNNFLDTDKASAPYWGFIALIVAMNVYTKPKQAVV